ncbi:MAG: PBP1A family penicillin-binding protein, partial [Acidobacteriota bacterium]|nr:PBP1A family penicillin-binding protein [Acidobacteriota bacterium]
MAHRTGSVRTRSQSRSRPRGRRRLRLQKPLVILALIGALALSGTLGFQYVQFSRLIDSRLHGERERVIPRVFARPLTLSTGQTIGAAEAIARLNDLGYAERGRADVPGEFAAEGGRVTLIPRAGAHSGRSVVLSFSRPASGAAPPKASPLSRLARIDIAGRRSASVTLEPPVLTGLVSGGREKRRRVALGAIPMRVREAVLAIEDRRFYSHPGVDPIRMARALATNLAGSRSYLVGASTITQQLARSFFLTDEMAEEQQSRQRSLRRKMLEQCMAVMLETKASKSEILELYLNDVYLGHRGSFAVHGVAEGSRVFFGKDVTNLTLAEAALLAGVIQSPSNHSPFTSQERARERRNVVLRAMVDAGYISADAAARATAEPVTVVPRAVDDEAPYFVDYIRQELDEAWPGLTSRPVPLDIYTTLDLNLQRAAQDAVRDGVGRVDDLLMRRRRRTPNRAQAALVAVDPRSGEILAMVGGRFYNQSQFNRAVLARRQPGSTFKPFVYLAAFEHAADKGLSDLTPATMVLDEPTTWTFDGQEWAPGNYGNEYDGWITLRRALALSRNIATIKVAEQIGFDTVAALWARTGVGAQRLKPYPSIALGAFELSPLEVATAYTVFPGQGVVTPLRTILRVVAGDETLSPPIAKGRATARPSSTYLVTNMMRSVLDEGTGAGARAAGFLLDAAGKSGTTNDLRDAWFVGFTPELLTVVWVGFDDNAPLGLTGSQAALPIWTSFMRTALAGRTSRPFPVPQGISIVDIDRD